MPLPALRFGYIVLAAQDIAALSAWYRDVLGFTVLHAGRQAELGTEYAILEGHGVRLEFAGRPGAAREHLPELPGLGFMEQPGWRVVTFHTDDLDALQAHLDAHGATVAWSQRRFGPGIVSTLLRDPEGNLINVFGPAE